MGRWQRYTIIPKSERALFLDAGTLHQEIARHNQNRGISKAGTHLFRHTFVQKYLMVCSRNAFTLQKLLGHSS